MHPYSVEEKMMELMQLEISKELDRDILNKMATQFGSNLRI